VLRQALQVVAGLAVGLVIVMVVGLIMVVVALSDDVAGGGGPHRAEFIDQPVGSAEASKRIALTGDLLLRAKDRSVAVQSLDDLAARPVPLFEAWGVSSVAPDGRHLIAFTDIDRWQVIRLRDLRAVADIQGGEPFFVDGDQVLTVFVGRGCKRGDATVMDLGARTQRPLRLSGDRAGLTPMEVVDDEVLAMRLQPGDSGGCMADGMAAVGLETGVVRALATDGLPAAVGAGHAWLTSKETTVLDRAGLSVGSGPRVMAAPVGDRMVYAEDPLLPYEQSRRPRAPTPLRVGAATGPAPSDPVGDGILEPQLIVATWDGGAVLVAHRGEDLPGGGHQTVLSICPLPDLRCRLLVDVTYDSRRATVVPAAVLVTLASAGPS